MILSHAFLWIESCWIANNAAAYGGAVYAAKQVLEVLIDDPPLCLLIYIFPVSLYGGAVYAAKQVQIE